MTLNKAIRLSPSGPTIGNDTGAPFAPGTGAQLRLVEAQTTVGATNQIPTAPAVIGNAIGSGNFGVGLLLPNPDYNYRVTVACDVENPSTNSLGEVQLYIETSVDVGVTWTERASNTHKVNSAEVAPAAPQARHIRCDLGLTLGSALGVVAGSPSLLVRAKIGASSGGGVVLVSSAITPGGDTKSVGTVIEQLAECW